MTDMYPCISNNKFAKLAAFVVTEDYIIKVFMKNYITIIKKNNKLQPFV